MNLTEPDLILLIDDDEATNFIHEIVIRSAGVRGRIQSVRTGKEALTILKKYCESDSEYGIVFLDINMPAMNGWEVIGQIKMLASTERKKILIVILTTSMNPDDRKKAESFSEVDLFMSKPLTKDAIRSILQRSST